jgi:hypothetical protein
MPHGARLLPAPHRQRGEGTHSQEIYGEEDKKPTKKTVWAHLCK